MKLRHPSIRRRTQPRCSRTVGATCVLGLAIGVLLASGTARAAGDDTVLLPNALILLDTSGSMERTITGDAPGSNEDNTCWVGTAGTDGERATVNPNRWGRVIETFSGTLKGGYRCMRQTRSPTGDPRHDLVREYQIKMGGQVYPPYDQGYILPYHRPVVSTGTGMNNKCVLAPGFLPGVDAPNGVGVTGRSAGGAAWEYPPTAIVNRTLDKDLTEAPDTTLACFEQNPDGIIDANLTTIRFGLMTFDTDSGEGTGVTTGGFGTTSAPRVGVGPFLGTWSYFGPPTTWTSGAGWNWSGSGHSTIQPDGCDTPSAFEVGARNPAAPPWEGRMITFEDLAVPLTDEPLDSFDIPWIQANNERIQKTISATRPFGATPIDAMLRDAERYWFEDPVGPYKRDKYIGADAGACRETFNILITDGEPNLNGRPACGSNCPYLMGYDTAKRMAEGTAVGGKAKVKTFVIGFAVSSFASDGSTTLNNCATADLTDCATVTLGSPKFACCSLQQIAKYGGTERAYFADNATDLRTALDTITALIAPQTTSRTLPAYSPVITTVAGESATTAFLSSVNPKLKEAWSGNLQRKRFQCAFDATATPPSYSVKEQDIDPAKGDDFAANLNSNPAERWYFTAVAHDSSDPTVATDTPTGIVRREATTGRPDPTVDGLPASAVVDEVGGKTGSAVKGLLTPEQLGIFTATAINCPNKTNGTVTKDDCKNRALNYAMARPAAEYGNADLVRNRDAFGEIRTAQPAAFAPGAALLQDESYQKYRDSIALPRYRAIAQRMLGVSGTLSAGFVPSIVVANTNDGLTHAFLADIDKLAQNEIFSWILPRTLSQLPSAYKGRVPVLEGSPVIAEGVSERTKADATDPLNRGKDKWRVWMVTPYGQTRGFAALDFTDPDPERFAAGGGPRFLWSLGDLPGATAALDTKQLFGSQGGGAAAITTVSMVEDPNIAESDSNPRKEISVAILAGGWNGPVNHTTGCVRASAVGSADVEAGPTNELPTDFPARNSVRCWGATPSPGEAVAGRSITIVRMDNGQILRVFARASDKPYRINSALLGLSGGTPFDSPMTGPIEVYPNGVGAIAKKLFAGDADGTLWSCDLTSTNVAAWSCKMFMDLYSPATRTAFNTLPSDERAQPLPDATEWWNVGQPIRIPPVLGTDSVGRLTVAVAAGITDNFSATGLYSLFSTTETLGQTSGGDRRLQAKVNWWLPFADGNRVSGPMALFDGTLYFSTYQQPSGNAACALGRSYVYGVDNLLPWETADIAKGGLPRYRLAPRPGPTGATCTRGVVEATEPTPRRFLVEDVTCNDDTRGKVNPGLSVQRTPACANTSAQTFTDPVTGATHYVANSVLEGQYAIFGQVAAKDKSGSTPTVGTIKSNVQLMQTPSKVDSWSWLFE